MSPYKEALVWINQHPGTGSSSSMAKLVLSFWNQDCAFTFRECIGNLDDNLTRMAMRMASHFAAHGEDEDLVEVGHEICERFPRLWEAGQAMTNTRNELRRQWDREDEAQRLAEYPNED